MTRAPLIHVRLDYRAGAWMASFYVPDDKAPGGYIADPEVVRACGTHTIPTPFTLQASANTVLREVRDRNPEAIVECLS